MYAVIAAAPDVLVRARRVTAAPAGPGRVRPAIYGATYAALCYGLSRAPVHVAPALADVAPDRA